MAILKSEIKNKFTTIPNSVIKNKDLTDAEYRLLIYLYSLPDGWKINQGYLGNELNCSRININKKLRKIKEQGYLEINKSDNDKSTDYVYILKEKGVSLEDVSPSDVSVSDVSPSDTHINTNIINTNITNTNINNKLNEFNLYNNFSEDVRCECNAQSTGERCKRRSSFNINGKNYCNQHARDLIPDLEFELDEKTKSKNEIAKSIIDYLNQKTNSNYKHSTKTTKEKINTRLKEGFTLDDFIVVIDKKYDEWVGTEYEKFLRPETLFGTKFESYLNQKNNKTAKQRTSYETHRDMTKEELDAWELEDD